MIQELLQVNNTKNIGLIKQFFMNLSIPIIAYNLYTNFLTSTPENTLILIKDIP